MSDISLTEYAV